jgi:hypothetical protein
MTGTEESDSAVFSPPRSSRGGELSVGVSEIAEAASAPPLTPCKDGERIPRRFPLPSASRGERAGVGRSAPIDERTWRGFPGATPLLKP